MLLALLLACTTTSSTATSACTLPAPSLDPVEGPAGTRVQVTLPVSGEAWDTLVQVNGQNVSLSKFDASTCETCEACWYDEGCAHCGECDVCEEQCAECSQVATIVVPDLAPGSYPVRVVNASGTTAAATFTVLASDTGGDTAADTDTSAVDTDTAADTSAVDTDTAADTSAVDTDTASAFTR